MIPAHLLDQHARQQAERDEQRALVEADPFDPGPQYANVDRSIVCRALTDHDERDAVLGLECRDCRTATR